MPSGYFDLSFPRFSADLVGGRVVAPEVLVVAKVELDPATPRGSLSAFSENPSPARLDSAARASDATGPVDSLISL